MCDFTWCAQWACKFDPCTIKCTTRPALHMHSCICTHILTPPPSTKKLCKELGCHAVLPVAMGEAVLTCFQISTICTIVYPTCFCVQLWEKLTGQRVGPARALPALESMFSPAGSSQGGSTTQRACVTLLVVDEIDVLITKDQSVRGSVFEPFLYCCTLCFFCLGWLAFRVWLVRSVGSSDVMTVVL